MKGTERLRGGGDEGLIEEEEVSVVVVWEILGKEMDL